MLPAQILAWNQTEADYPRQKTIGELFEEQVDRTPDAIALVAGDRFLSYRELDDRVNRLAGRLRTSGVGPETLVGVAIERSHEMIVGLLATLKAGGAYVPIDPSHPRDRIADIVNDARIAVLLTSSRNLAQLPEFAPVIICDSPEADSIVTTATARVASAVTSDNLAYVLHTSGSSGKPKGVMVQHRNVVNFFSGMDRVIGTAPGVWLAVTSVVFDISVLELLWTLTRGFTVVLHGEEGVQTIAAEIKKYNVTHLQSTPSLMRMLLMDTHALSALGSVKKLILGGEALTSSLVTQVRQSMRGEIYNAYGPTETTIWSTIYLINEDATTIPIGRPIINTRVYILDSKLQPVPSGDIGRLYIGGDGVARGYLNQPNLTAERFLSDPFFAGGRIYNTGDLARFLPDGNIEYCGREDFQVKVRGFRIELGEIEATLEKHPSIHQAVVVAREDKFGDKRLLAYIVKKPGLRPDVTGPELRSDIQTKLPHYMVPSKFIFMKRLPLTSSGKIDRKALPATVASSGAETDLRFASEQPPSRIQGVIEQAWKEALDLDQLGLHENFFDLGANSLLVVEVHGELQQRLGREIPLVDLFHFPCVADLANHLCGAPTPHPVAGASRAHRRLAARANRVFK